MDLVFVVPGIMGSELHLDGKKLWPPKILSKVKNPHELLDPGVIAVDVIRNVLVFGFYEKLLIPLDNWGYRERHPGNKGLVIPWPYNWVKAIPDNAKLLADTIRTQSSKHPEMDVVLLAHSMGGLICTYALECLAEQDKSWRERVRLLVTFGTPFLGAPESLKNAFGVEGAMGITAGDCHRLMADPAFPSAYQLFPHLHAFPAWADQPPLDPLPHYQALDPNGLPLGQQNLQAAAAFQQAMQSATPNPGTRKFNFCGTKYKTVWAMGAVSNSAGMINSYESKAGDGTVPSWSGRQNASVQFAPLGAKHSKTFGDSNLLYILRELLAKATPPGGAPPGLMVPVSFAPPLAPSPQPSVSVTKNAISSLLSEVEIEVSEPPEDGLLHLAWIPLEGAETPQDLSRHLAMGFLDAIPPQTSIPIGAELEYPLLLSIPRPKNIGEYALVAWAGEAVRTAADLDVERLDVVWVFEDQDQGTTDGGEPAVIESGFGDFIDRDNKTRDELLDQRTASLRYHNAD